MGEYDALFKTLGWQLISGLMKTYGIFFTVETRGNTVDMRIDFPEHLVFLTGKVQKKAPELKGKGG